MSGNAETNMHEQDLQAGIDGLSREEMARLLKDLAGDPDLAKRIVTAVNSSQ
ncbi:hypothetical protein diail_6313 [Diaporthe ilicicola]|nr:hypothetical protein diail_6313 [Diaporthe ilicicola]